MPISEASETSLAAAPLTPRDQAAAALVRRYAELIDNAESLAAEANVLWGELDPEDADGRRRLAKLEAAVSAHGVTSDLGPKLLAALTALGCTLAGRAAKAGEPNRAADPALAAHDELKAKRAARLHVSPTLDPTAPGTHSSDLGRV